MHALIIALVTLLAEGIGAGALVFLACLAMAAPGDPAHFTGLGFGFATAAMTAFLLILTRAMLTPGGAILRHLLYMTNLDQRKFHPLGAHELLAGWSHWFDDHHVEEHEHAHRRLMHRVWNAGFDLVMMLLIIGFHLAGSVLGVLSARFIDKTSLIAAVAQTKPFGPLAGDTSRALFASWALNSIVLLVYAVTTTKKFPGKFSDDQQIKLSKKKNRWSMFAALTTVVAIGLVVFVAVMGSYTMGVGTVLNFGADLAIGVFITHSTKFLWISAVGQILGALTAFVIMLVAWAAFRASSGMKKLFKHMHGHYHKVKSHVHGDEEMQTLVVAQPSRPLPAITQQ